MRTSGEHPTFRLWPRPVVKQRSHAPCGTSPRTFRALISKIKPGPSPGAVFLLQLFPFRIDAAGIFFFCESAPGFGHHQVEGARRIVRRVLGKLQTSCRVFSVRLSCSHNDPEFLNHIKRGAATQVPSLTNVH